MSETIFTKWMTWKIRRIGDTEVVIKIIGWIDSNDRLISEAIRAKYGLGLYVALEFPSDFPSVFQELKAKRSVGFNGCLAGIFCNQSAIPPTAILLNRKEIDNHKIDMASYVPVPYWERKTPKIERVERDDLSEELLYFSDIFWRSAVNCFDLAMQRIDEEKRGTIGDLKVKTTRRRQLEKKTTYAIELINRGLSREDAILQALERHEENYDKLHRASKRRKRANLSSCLSKQVSLINPEYRPKKKQPRKKRIVPKK